MSFLVQLVMAQFLGFPLRGRVLGGSSAINGGFYSRATEEFVCKDGWDKELVKVNSRNCRSKLHCFMMMNQD